jgi:hypothetical protein
MASRVASTQWSGGLQDGSGQVTLVSSGTGTFDVSFPRRTADEAEGVTSPEELIAAAHSSCYSMALSLELTNAGEGVQIFIGADSPLFANTGCSMVVAPFRDSQERILGAIGVIGPTRLNYARIIPLVDYTARTIGRMVG